MDKLDWLHAVPEKSLEGWKSRFEGVVDRCKNKYTNASDLQSRAEDKLSQINEELESRKQSAQRVTSGSGWPTAHFKRQIMKKSWLDELGITKADFESDKEVVILKFLDQPATDEPVIPLNKLQGDEDCNAVIERRNREIDKQCVNQWLGCALTPIKQFMERYQVVGTRRSDGENEVNLGDSKRRSFYEYRQQIY